METLQIDIINPKAKSLLKNLAALNLIKIRSRKSKSELKELLNRLRSKSEEAPTLEEILDEVEAVRSARYEEEKSNL
jgi:tRNA C32,U32 (ribose-2'-O)-methylase TrmJ